MHQTVSGIVVVDLIRRELIVEQDSCFIRCCLRFSDFDIRILFTELFLEHLTDVTAILTLLLHSLDALICGKQR